MSNNKNVILMEGGISLLMLLVALLFSFSAPQVFGRGLDWWRGAIVLTIVLDVAATLVRWRRAPRNDQGT